MRLRVSEVWTHTYKQTLAFEGTYDIQRGAAALCFLSQL